MNNAATYLPQDSPVEFIGRFLDKLYGWTASGLQQVPLTPSMRPILPRTRIPRKVRCRLSKEESQTARLSCAAGGPHVDTNPPKAVQQPTKKAVEDLLVHPDSTAQRTQPCALKRTWPGSLQMATGSAIGWQGHASACRAGCTVECDDRGLMWFRFLVNRSFQCQCVSTSVTTEVRSGWALIEIHTPREPVQLTLCFGRFRYRCHSTAPLFAGTW